MSDHPEKEIEDLLDEVIIEELVNADDAAVAQWLRSNEMRSVDREVRRIVELDDSSILRASLLTAAPRAQNGHYWSYALNGRKGGYARYRDRSNQLMAAVLVGAVITGAILAYLYKTQIEELGGPVIVSRQPPPTNDDKAHNGELSHDRLTSEESMQEAREAYNNLRDFPQPPDTTGSQSAVANSPSGASLESGTKPPVADGPKSASRVPAEQHFVFPPPVAPTYAKPDVTGLPNAAGNERKNDRAPQTWPEELSVIVPSVLELTPGMETSLPISFAPVTEVPYGAFVFIRGLPESVSLSAGRHFVGGLWAVSASEVDGLRIVGRRLPNPDRIRRFQIEIKLVSLESIALATTRSEVVIGNDPERSRSADKPQHIPKSW